MSDFGNRSIVQVLRGTAAVRATLTLALGELWLDVDGAGEPTGDLWTGDGSTAGGVRVERPGVLLADGSVPTTGLFTFGANFQQASLDPLTLLVNTRQENAEHGRGVDLICGGEKADGTPHSLGQITVDHEGSGDDQQGKLRLYLNDGADGFAPTLALTFTGSDSLAIFAGEVRHTHGRVCCRRDIGSRGIDQTTRTMLFATDIRTDTGFSYSGGEFTVSFDGWVSIAYDMSVELTSGTRFHTLYELEVDTGGGYAAVAGSRRWSYHRASVDGSSTSCSGLLVEVSSGDKFRLRATASGTTETGSTLAGGCMFRMERVQGAS